jgi:hypothetical protein
LEILSKNFCRSNNPLSRSERGGRYARTIVVDGHHGTVREVFDGRWDAT